MNVWLRLKPHFTTNQRKRIRKILFEVMYIYIFRYIRWCSKTSKTFLPYLYILLHNIYIIRYSLAGKFCIFYLFYLHFYLVFYPLQKLQKLVLTISCNGTTLVLYSCFFKPCIGLFQRQIKSFGNLLHLYTV